MALVPALDLRSRADHPIDPANDGAAALPANVEAETALLGALMFDNGVYERLPDGLVADHFSEPFHGRLFAAAERLIRTGALAEPITLSDAFVQDPAFRDLGGTRYLADLVDFAPPAANARDYAKIIMEMARRRELIRIGGDLIAGATAPEEGQSSAEVMEAAEGALYALGETGVASRGFQDAGTYITAAVEMAARAYSRDGAVAGLSTGLADLDQKIGGLHPSDLVILAARPSMGKSSLAVNIGVHAARSYRYEQHPDGTRKTISGGIVGFFSLEMSADQLGLRMLADVSGVSGDRLRKGDVKPLEFGQVRDAAIELAEIPLYVDDTGGLSLAKLAARARRMKRTKGLDLLIVDYLQLVTISGYGRPENRVQEVSAITQGLKALAKELQVPVIALSQLSRQVETREDKKPQLSDLRESGSIEQDADMVMFLYREEYYLKRTEPRAGTSAHENWLSQLAECQGQAEVIIGKQRHGPIGTVRLSFNEDLTKFGNLARESHFASRKPYGDD